MSLEQVDQLIGILYNERMKEQHEEIEQLKSIKTYGIYNRYHLVEFANHYSYNYEYQDDRMKLYAIVMCCKEDIIKHVDNVLDKLLPHCNEKIWPVDTDYICEGSIEEVHYDGGSGVTQIKSEKIYVKELPQNELTFTLNFCENH